MRLVRELYEGGLSREDVLQLFRIIDWMMDLPKPLEQLFKQEAEQIEQERHMAYVTSVERLAKQEGQAEMLIRAVERRFHVPIPEEVTAQIRSASDSATLERWMDLAFAVSSFEEFQQRMQS